MSFRFLKTLGLLAWFVTVPLIAAENKMDLLYLEAGAIVHDAGRYSTAPTGETSLMGATYIDFALSAFMPLGGEWYFSPFLGYTPFGNKSADVGEKTKLLPVALRLEKNLSSFFLHFGPGLMIHQVAGSGGTATLSNGTGTSVFGLPNETRSAKYLFIDLGVGISEGAFRLGLDAWITGALSSQRRAVSFVLNLGYGIF